MAKNKKTTQKKASKSASRVLKDKDSGKKSKTASGSALSQTGTPKRQTGKKAASSASRTMKDGRTSKASKSAAGSALAQTPKTKDKKVPAARKKTAKKAPPKSRGNGDKGTSSGGPGVGRKKR